MASMKLLPLIRWPGGQSRMAHKFNKLIPEHSTYVEPFAGGASFFFHKKPVETEVLGDTNDWLIPFYDDVRHGGLRKCKSGITYSQKTLDKSLNKYDACSRLAVSAIAFGGYLGAKSGKIDQYRGRMGMTSKDKVYTAKLKKLDRYEKRLRHANLTTGSFDRTMKQFDGPDAFHLLDPPWPDNYSDTYYGNDDSEVTPQRVAKTVKKMKGKVWVLYNVHPKVIEAFQGLHIYRVPLRNFDAKRSSQKSERLLISNYPLNKGERRKKSDR